MKKISIELNEIDQMIFVATLPRSGSSMDCGILEACGAFGGDTIGSVPANKKGIFENRGLNGLVMRPLFEEMDVRSPRALLTVHKSGGPPKEMFESFRDDFTYGLNRQGYKSGVAYYKNGIYTFMFNRINEVFPNAIWVLPHRNKNDVIKSTQKINPDKPFDLITRDIGDYRFMYDHIQAVAGDRAFVIDNDELVTGDFSQIKAVVEAAGLTWSDEAIEGWIDNDLWGTADKPPSEEEIEYGQKVKRGSNNRG